MLTDVHPCSGRTATTCGRSGCRTPARPCRKVAHHREVPDGEVLCLFIGALIGAEQAAPERRCSGVEPITDRS
jgi:hypothetical protein